MAVAQHEILPGKALIINLSKMLLVNRNALQELNWILTAKRMSVVLIYLTDKNMAEVWDFIGREKLLNPDVLVTESGSEIRWSPDYSIDDEWSFYLTKNQLLESDDSETFKHDLAVKYLQDRLSLKKRDIILCGSNEVLSLFQSGYQGILMKDKRSIVRIPVPKWVYKAGRPYAGGILEGLKHYNFGV